MVTCTRMQGKPTTWGWQYRHPAHSAVLGESDGTKLASTMTALRAMCNRGSLLMPPAHDHFYKQPFHTMTRASKVTYMTSFDTHGDMNMLMHIAS